MVALLAALVNLTRAQTPRVSLVENARHALPPVSAPEPKHPSTHTRSLPRSLAQSICIPGFEIGGAVEHEEEEQQLFMMTRAEREEEERKRERRKKGRKEGRKAIFVRGLATSHAVSLSA